MLSRGARFLGQYVASQPTQLLESILRVSSAACGTYESTELGTPVSQACTYGGWLASRGFAATAAPKPSSAPATPVPAQEGLQIDPTAVQRLKDLAKERGGKPTLLRIEVEGGGCSGFQYKFSLDSNTAPTDIVFEKDGERVIVDNVSLEFLQGAKVEFEDSLMRSSFVISANPNSEASCGCGSSFTAKMKK